jgi:hypothetical protein
MIAVTAARQGTNIMIIVSGGPGLADAGNFTIQLNGVAQAGKLAANAGASSTVSSTGAPESDHLVIVANYKNGAQSVVLDKFV